MFELHNLAALRASAKVLEDNFNRNLEFVFIQAATSWSQALEKGPMPEAPFKQLIMVDEATMNLIVGQSKERVSDLDPRSLLPKYGTDVEGSRSPVGTPIPGSPGRFHQSSSSNPQHGDLYPPDAPKFKYVKPYPFGGFWEAIS